MHTKAAATVMAIMIGMAGTAQAIQLEVMSFNVQQPFGTNWEGRRDKAVDMLIQEKPDVVGTQEAVSDQRNYLLARLPEYGWYGKGRDGGDAGEGSWIFYSKERFRVDSSESGNFWLSGTPGTPSRFGGSYNRISTHVRLIEKSTGQGFYVFNSHFYLSSEGDYRMRSARMVADAMAKRPRRDEPAISIGDFKSGELDAVTRWFKSGPDNPVPLRDSYRDVYPNGSVTTGFGTKFDYVYVEDKALNRSLKAWVVESPSGVSDHMPISALVELGAQASSLLLPPRSSKAPLRALGFVEGGHSLRVDGRILPDQSQRMPLLRP
jgi:endonuclease/exonuclease/phosphatase family metal-dependent hydrolase